MTPGRIALAVALAAALGGCAPRDTVASAAETTGTNPTPTDPTPVSTTDPTPVSTTTSSAAYCRGIGPPILLDGTCTGVLSQRAFARAACTCTAAAINADLVTDGFDSRVAPWAAGGVGADVGAVGGLSFNGLLRVGGSLAVSGAGIRAGATLAVAGNLDAGGDLGLNLSVATVGGDARIAGNVGVSSLSVGGTLTTPADATLAGTISAATRVSAAVSVPPACPCSAAEAVDVAGIVAQHRAANDNAGIGLSSSALADVSMPLTLPLPCGRYYLDRIQGAASLKIRATGRVALFVGGTLTYSGPLTIALDPGAELDLFVTGAVNLPATLSFGDPARPSALRIWWAAGGSIFIPYGAQWSANLYAPSADLAVDTPLDLYGSAMVLHLNNSAPLNIHYDRAIAAAATTCGQ